MSFMSARPMESAYSACSILQLRIEPAFLLNDERLKCSRHWCQYNTQRSLRVISRDSRPAAPPRELRRSCQIFSLKKLLVISASGSKFVPNSVLVSISAEKLSSQASSSIVIWLACDSTVIQYQQRQAATRAPTKPLPWEAVTSLYRALAR